MGPWRSEVPLHLKESYTVEASVLYGDIKNTLCVSPNAQDTYPFTWNFGFERKEACLTMCVCVCVCVYIHTHTYIYIYIYSKTYDATWLSSKDRENHYFRPKALFGSKCWKGNKRNRDLKCGRYLFWKWLYENKEWWKEAELYWMIALSHFVNSYPWLFNFLNISNKSAIPWLNSLGRNWLWLVQNHLSSQLKD